MQALAEEWFPEATVDIKEISPTSFEVEQTVQTKPRANTCTLNTKNNQIILITTEPAADAGAASATPPPRTDQPGASKKGGKRDAGGPALLDILVVGR